MPCSAGSDEPMKRPPVIDNIKRDISRLIARFEREDCLVNLAGNYDYLELPYYMSQDLENSGQRIHPTCKEALDAYVTPLSLEKACLSGMAIPVYYITNNYFEPPVVIDSVNPFMIRSRIVTKRGREESVAQSLTRNYKYSICCQEIPPGAKIKHIRVVMGWCNVAKYRDFAAEIWRVFRIPLARVRIMELNDGRILFSDLAQLPYEKLHQKERAFLKGVLQWEE